MIEFRLTKWPRVKDVILPLWERHWQEIGTNRDVIPLDPDWDAYDRMHLKGGLKIVGAFDGEEMVGYVFAIITGHLHYRSTKCGFYDLYWLAPEYRKGLTGVRMFREMERVLRDLKVVKVYAPTKLEHDKSTLFKRMGWSPAEVMFTNVL